MGNKYVAGYQHQPVYMGSTGSVGWMGYWSTGSFITGLGFAPAGQFAGVLEQSQVAGSTAVICTEGVYEFTKGNGSDIKIEAGQPLYGSGASAVATAQVSTGSVIGVAWEQSSSDNANVAVQFKGNLSKAH